MRENSEFLVKEQTKFLTVLMPIVTLFILPQAFDPVNYPKLTILFLIIGYLLPVVIISVFTKEFGIRRDIFLLLVTIFLFSITFSLLFGPGDKLRSLIGSYGRGHGWIYFFALSLTLIVASRMKIENAFSIFKKGFVFTSLTVIIYALLQYQNIDFVRWNFDRIGGYSLIATLGNPNHLSALSSLTTVFFFFLLIDSWKSTKRVSPITAFHLFMGLLSTLVVFLAESFQGKVMIGIGIILLLVSSFGLVARINKRVRFLLFTLVTGISVIFLGAVSGFVSQLSFLTQETLKYRFDYWTVAIRITLDHPVFGVGIDSLGDFYSSYRTKSEALSNLSLVDNPHNLFLHLTSTWGVLVGILLLAIFAYVSICAFRILTSCDGISTQVILSILWIMYFAQLLISVEQAALDIWGWFIGGAVVSAHRNLAPIGKEIDLNSRNNLKKISQTITAHQFRIRTKNREFENVLSKLFLLVCIVIAIWFNVRTIEFNKIRMSANVIEDTGSGSIPPQDILKVRDFFSFDPTYSRLVSLVALGSRNESLGFSILEESVRRFPTNYELLKLYALSLEISQRTQDALPIRQRLTELEPNRSESWLGLASNLQLLGRREEAISILNYAVPKVVDPEYLKSRITSVGTTFAVGDIVFHNLFGAGEVIESGKSILRIKFNNEYVGIKAFDPRTAPITLARFVSPSLG